MELLMEVGIGAKPLNGHWKDYVNVYGLNYLVQGGRLDMGQQQALGKFLKLQEKVQEKMLIQLKNK